MSKELPNNEELIQEKILEISDNIEAGNNAEDYEEMLDYSEISDEEKEEKEEELVLKLGDVIYITDPTNEILNDNTFLIDYIDAHKIKLLNADTFAKTQLLINSNGSIGDGTITGLNILSSNKNTGYARQNGLLSGTWVNIYFGGDTPVIITGEITNLENDMIELRTLDGDIIYINFDYQGIPEDLPIETFEIRTKPDTSTTEEIYDKIDDKIDDGYELEEGEIHEYHDKVIPTEKVKERIEELLFNVGDIQFGEMLGTVKENKTIDKDKYRFNIETQSTDLLDELVSTIPNMNRTSTVLNNIHTMITRFIQLREQSSTFDINHNLIGPIKITSDDKPLSKYLSNIKNNLYWIMLVAKNIKKVYEQDTQRTGLFGDYELINQDDNLVEMKQKFKNAKSNSGGEEQNRYIELYNSLNSYMTPFENDLTNKNQIVETSVNSDMNVIIDNLGDLYSTVVAKDAIVNRKFVINRYNLGLDRLQATNLKGSKMVSHRVKLTKNDNIAINSLITLPEPTVRFSQVNLPGSSILVKSNLSLHFLNYWQLLKENTKYTVVDINSLDNEIEHTDTNFIDNIKNYVLNLSIKPDKLTNLEIYNEFLKVVIPKTRVLFKLVKKYIKGRLSMVDVINYLEPFLIYSDDLTFNQYKEIDKFINEKIKEYNKTYIEYSRAFSVLKTLDKKRSNRYLNPILEILNNNQAITANVFGWYGLDENGVINMSGSETLKKIKLADFGNLFNTAVAFENISLMFPDELSKVFDLDNDKLTNRLETDIKNDTCNNYIIAKKYFSKALLEADNNKSLYFDKQFDETNYDLLESDFKKEKETLEPDELELYISEQFKLKKKYDDSSAEYLAESLVNGAKKVRDGQYAILTEEEEDIPYLPSDLLVYYVRKDDIWSEVKDIDPKLFIKDEDILCNIQEKCIFNPNNQTDNCESLEVSKDNILRKAIKEILEQFDKNYEISKEQLQVALDRKISYYGGIFEKLKHIKNKNRYQNNDIQYALGMTVVDSNAIIVSPYQNIIDTILGQSDFVKKQTDILKFVKIYARQGNPTVPNIHDGEMENQWFYYCNQTDTKLLPTFAFILARTFVMDRGNYDNELKRLIKEIGVSMENGEWIDRNSGMTICLIDLDVEEGYEDGFKVKSRAMLEEDAGDVVLNIINKTKNKMLSPQGEIVSNIIETLSTNAGIDISNQREFIIKIVTELMHDVNVLPKESGYKLTEEMAFNLGKKIQSYTTLYNSTLMYLTLAMFLIGIQTSIPSIKTHKTFPGCVRSFTGFPLEGSGDESGLLYVACIANASKSKVSPWIVLGGKTKETDIRDRIKKFSIKFVLNYPEVELKIREKISYLITNPELDIPLEHQLTNWSSFLPPLQRIRVKGLQNISESFEQGLIDKIKMGNSKQYDDLLVIQSKVIDFSMAIQEHIQKIVDNKDLLLKSSLKPFMNNACCSDDSMGVTTLQYFINNNSEIKTNNVIVHQLSAILRDIKLLTQSAIFLSSVDTKVMKPDSSTTSSYAFSEDTIYLAFITMCKFNSLIPLTDDMITVCNEKPEYITKNETLHEQISKLKRDGKNYTVASFLRLFQIVSRNNIIKMNFHSSIPSYSDSLRYLLVRLEEINNNTIAPALTEKINGLLDISDIPLQEDKPEMRTMKNYLDSSIKKMRIELLDFIKRKSNVGERGYDKIVKFIKELSIWKFDTKKRDDGIAISDNAMYNYINYFKTFIKLISITFPTMILNAQTHVMETPVYWGLSQKDSAKIEKYVTDYYSPLMPYYDNVDIKNILTTVKEECKYVVALSNETPVLTSIKFGDKETYSSFDKKTVTLLYEYYILQTLTQYVNLTKNPEMVSRIMQEQDDETLSGDFLIAEQLRFSETEQDFIKGDVNRLQTTIGGLLVAYIRIMMDSKDVIDISYDTIMDRVFKLKEREKDAFTDRLRKLRQNTDESEVDKILRINNLGVWGRGSEKTYVADDNDAQKILMLEIAETEQRGRSKGLDDGDIDGYIEDAMNDKRVQEEIDREELSIVNVSEDYMDGDPHGDEDDDGN